MSKKPYPCKIGRLSASSKGKLPQARKQTLNGGPGQADQAFPPKGKLFPQKH